MTGLLIDDALVPVPGLTIVAPASHGGPAWATLRPGDCRPRSSRWIRQLINHSTSGDWPQLVREGAGNRGLAARIANLWGADPTHSGAHLVIDTDGTVVCLADLVRTETYHAEGSNPWSVGIEMCVTNGAIYRATLAAAVTLDLALCGLLGIPAQIHSAAYRGEPLRRMEVVNEAGRHNSGGPDVVGIFGHRDNTSRRGRGDPGNELYAMLVAAGCEAFDFDRDEDRIASKWRQAALNARDLATRFAGPRLTIDGLCGPASIAAMKRQGFVRWQDVT